jgi:AraC family transcriptional regulator of arabinose operon
MDRNAKVEVRVLSVSHLRQEPPTFHLIRENGQNAINFVHFLTPVIIICAGTAMHMVKNACIIYTPGERQEYKADQSGIVNNFVTFTTDVAAFLPRYDLPLNEPFYIKDDNGITRQIDSIAWAAANRLELLDAELTMWVNELFTQLEQNHIGADPKSRRDMQTKQRFIALRGEIRLNPRGWTVGKMAAAVWLTRSRFCVVYKEYFGVSPGTDLETAMLAYAKDRLLNTSETVAAIAADCGYRQAESFIRLFRAREGVTPGQYRGINDLSAG